MNFKLKFKTLKIIAIGVVTALAFNLASPNFLRGSETQAVGDLDIDWGVPDGDPIFVVNGAMPGDIETRSVLVTNNASSIRPLGVRGVLDSETGDLKSILELTISVDSTAVYGGSSATGTRTLAQFFTESANINGLFLTNVNPTDTKTIEFEVLFPSSAGNEFQGTSVVFDLIIGISVEIPAECQNIEFSGDPIFGTELGDSIQGGPGNDLIFGLEGGDKINGNAGDDCIVGGEGGDSLKGNNGNDVVFGSEDSDSLKGENGTDLLIGGEGHDQAKGGNGNDVIFGSGGHDSLYGDAGDDTVEGGAGHDSMKGGPGNDSLIGGPDLDTANGEAGTDTCDAESERNCEI